MQESPEIVGTSMQLILRVQLTESYELHLSSSNLFCFLLVCFAVLEMEHRAVCMLSKCSNDTPPLSLLTSEELGLPVGPEKGWVAGCWRSRWEGVLRE